MSRMFLRRRRQRGFVLPTAIFLIVVMASLAAWMVRTFTLMRADTDLSIRAAYAYQAALAGIEWGSYQTLDPGNAWVAGTALPACPATTTLSGLAGTLAAYSVAVSCSGGSADTEGNHSVAVYRFSAKASAGTAGTSSYVERDVQTVVMLCKDATAAAPAYRCH